MEENREEFTVEQIDNNLVIKVPIDLLVWTQENREDNITIHSKVEMVKTFISYFLDSGNEPYGDERSSFEIAIDTFFDECIANGDTWLEYTEFMEEEENED